jgi:uncharacterized protein involved in exopolysaccharide biosynthesis
MEENKNVKQIDFTKIAKTLWPHRKTYYRVLPATLIITYLIVFCVPRYYTCSVSLAPESSGTSISGSLGSLASSFGLGGSLGKLDSQDALYAEIYPDILKSNDFIAELMTVQVETKDGEVKANYYTYLRDKQDAAWWNVAISKLQQMLLPTPKDTYNGETKISVFNLTKLQDGIFNSVKGKVKCSVDKKTDVVSITVKDQDPLVCATIAKATCEKLQAFIIDYRTNKARIDYEYYQKLCEESKVAYDKARHAYAAYSDANQDVVLARYKSKEADLENEMQLKYNIYTAMNTQMQAAAAKLQEATPAFTIIQSASVPIKPAGPKRTFIALAMTMLVFFGLSIRILAKSK